MEQLSDLMVKLGFLVECGSNSASVFMKWGQTHLYGLVVRTGTATRWLLVSHTIMTTSWKQPGADVILVAVASC